MLLEERPTTHTNNGGEQQPVDPETQQFSSTSSNPISLINKPKREDYKSQEEYKKALLEYVHKLTEIRSKNLDLWKQMKDELEKDREKKDLENKPEFGTFDKSFVELDKKIGLMSQTEASDKCYKLIYDIKRKFNRQVSLDVDAFNNFNDKRLELLMLKGINQVLGDFDLSSDDTIGIIKFVCRNCDSDACVAFNEFQVKTKTIGSINNSKDYMLDFFTIGEGNKFSLSLVLNHINIAINNRRNGIPQSSLERISSMFATSFMTGWWDWYDEKNDAFAICGEAIFHEYGHTVQHFLVNKELKDDELSFEYGHSGMFSINKAQLCKNVYDNHTRIMKEKIIEKAKLMFPDASEQELLDASGYAKNLRDARAGTEWFAETFANMYSPKPRKIALAMREYLKEQFKK